MKNIFVMKKVVGNTNAVQRYAKSVAYKQFGSNSHYNFEFVMRKIGTLNGVPAWNVFVKVTPVTHDRRKELMTAACRLVKSGQILDAPQLGIKVERRGNVYMVNDHRATKAAAKAAIHEFINKAESL